MPWIATITIGQAWGYCKTAMLFLTPATIVWATLWPIAWTAFIAPAIAQVAEQTMVDNLQELRELIDKVAAGQASVGGDSRDAAQRDKFIEALLLYSLCIQANQGNVAACGPQPEAPPT